MRYLKKRFFSILIIIILSCISSIFGYPNDNVIILPSGYEDTIYTYDFNKHCPDEFTKKKWEIEGDYPKGMDITSKGVFLGSIGDFPDMGKKEEKNYKFKIKISGKKNVNSNQEIEISEIFSVILPVKKSPPWNSAEKRCFLLGMEQSGASSSSSTQRVILSLYGSSSFPLKWKKKYSSEIGEGIQVWTNINLTSLPQQINDPLIKGQEAFVVAVQKLKINETVQAAEFLVGMDIRILNFNIRDRYLYTLNIFGAFGATTPICPEESAQTFKLPLESDSTRQEVITRLKNKYGNELDFTDKDYISLIRPERSKFYRQCFFGVRFKSYKKPQPIETQNNGVTYTSDYKCIYPTFFEVSVGRNDFIVDRQLMIEENANSINSLYYNNNRKEKDWKVLKIGGFLPIELKGITFYIFGTAMLQFKKGRTPLLSDPIILERAETSLYPDSKTLQIILGSENRDFYRIGIGMDLLGVIDKVL